LDKLLSSEKLWANCFALYAVLGALIFLAKLPPFMAPDELNHAKRADMVGAGHLLGERRTVGQTVQAGGPVEESLNAAEAPFRGIEFHPEVKVDPLANAKDQGVGWIPTKDWEPFENTAIYPPAFYLPAAIGIDFGKFFGVTVLSTLSLARALCALGSIAVGYAALRIAGRAGPLLFFALTLPMTLMLFSAVTQDGLMLATTALGCAFLSKPIEDGRELTRKELIGASACLLLVGMAKPPYVLFTLLLLLVRTERPALKWQAFGGVLGLQLVWHAVVTALIQAPIVRPDAKPDMAGQIHFLMSHPAALISVPVQTGIHAGPEYSAQMIGVLGWLDTLLPKPYYVAAYVLLVVGCCLTWTSKPTHWAWVLVIMGAVKLAIFGALYLSYTPVGAAQVDGVQGRYFLPVLLVLPLMLVSAKAATPSRVRTLATAAVLLFPVVSLFLTERALTTRYY
jgi:uncharacterized membrane protein